MGHAWGARGRSRGVGAMRGVWMLVVVILFGVASCSPARFVNLVDRSRAAGLRQVKAKKYWSASIGDIRRTGRYDLFLSDHNSRGVELYWAYGNDKFRYEWNNPILLADWHGTALGDLTGNGLLDLIATKGGGRGYAPGAPMFVQTYKQGRKVKLRKLKNNRNQLGNRAMRGRTARIFDMNGDGKLDVLYINAKPIRGRNVRIHFVYKNLGNNRFTLMNNVGFERVKSKWAILLDVNGDNIMDVLFLENEMQLWMGTGKFKFKRDFNRIPRSLDTSFMASAVEFDYNNDGKMDLYLCRGMRDGYGNKDDYLLKNLGQRFINVSRRANIPRGGVCMHATDGDFDNNGHFDLYVSQGGKGRFSNKDFMLMNQGNGRFRTVTTHGARARESHQRGHVAHTFDFDMDGRIDVLVGVDVGLWKLYKNSTPYSNLQWVLVRVGEKSNSRRPSMGALVTVKCGRKAWKQRVGSRGESHSHSYMDTLHFGLGRSCKNGKIERISVQYVLGGTQSVSRRQVKRLHKIGYYPILSSRWQ